MSDAPFSRPMNRRTLLQYFATAGAGLVLSPLIPLDPLASRLSAAPFVTAKSWRGLTPDQVESLLPGLMEKHSVPGVSVALLHNGEVSWRGAFGRLRADRSAPVTEDSIFQAASISKPLFAIGVMKLVEDGKLDLDAPLHTLLDEPWLEDQPLLELVTARMVLEHSTGWPNWRRGKPLVFRFRPGTGYSYSGEGFVYLQTAIQKLIDKPLDTWLRESVLYPLGMTASSYTWLDEMDGHGAGRHNASGKASGPRKFPKAMTSHSLLTNAGDLGKALAFMINQPTTDLLPSPETVQSMLVEQQPIPRKKGLSRGLGWVLQDDPKTFYHTGSNGGGHRALAMASTETGAGITILTNAAGGKKLYGELVQSATGRHPAFA